MLPRFLLACPCMYPAGGLSPKAFVGGGNDKTGGLHGPVLSFLRKQESISRRDRLRWESNTRVTLFHSR